MTASWAQVQTVSHRQISVYYEGTCAVESQVGSWWLLAANIFAVVDLVQSVVC
jgi:hypothetical protein